MKASRSESITIRGLRYHVRHWGRDGAPMLFMLHGWMDVSASFQFLVDALAQEWHVIAPDWRGFGLSEHAPGAYWHPDYLADLDALLLHYSPQHAVDLLGHSLGANVAGIYAGVRAQRVRKLILLEGFGMPAMQPQQAPARYAQWLDELRAPPAQPDYATQAEVAARLQKNNPRLSDERAAFLAGHWALQNAGGRWQILADSAHRLVNPYLYRVDEITACWAAITAPVLWVEAGDSELVPRLGGAGGRSAARIEIERRIAFLRNVTTLMVEHAGHMLQHDQPEILAAAIEDFLQR
jgi:pimeloyl-ACP methyl ester carboxylesterase